MIEGKIRGYVMCIIIIAYRERCWQILFLDLYTVLRPLVANSETRMDRRNGYVGRDDSSTHNLNPLSLVSILSS